MKLYMAPLKGVTDHIFRNTFARHFGGFHGAMAPFIATSGAHRIRRKYLKDVWPENNRELPVIPQILSKSPEAFIRLANDLFDMGHNTVNWNLGCPYPLSAAKNRGCRLLADRELVESFLETVVPALKGNLSIKTRLGWKVPEELFRLLPVFNRLPIAEVVIHPRIGIQGYTGVTDLTAFETCRSLSEHPLVFNGDLSTTKDFEILSRRFPEVNRWMIGRGALADPFFPGILASGAGQVHDKQIKLKAFHDDLLDRYSRTLHGPRHILDRMKGLWRYLAPSVKHHAEVFPAVKTAMTLSEYRRMVQRLFT
ncbi:MAG: tRNA-dihydrouridine synthase family protein [Desulfobacteraceae bacterium]|nr:tRNA-dihydrouridine synthase family protein [Desulfobacteraceae bacterium]